MRGSVEYLTSKIRFFSSLVMGTRIQSVLTITYWVNSKISEMFVWTGPNRSLTERSGPNFFDLTFGLGPRGRTGPGLDRTLPCLFGTKEKSTQTAHRSDELSNCTSEFNHF